MREISCDFYRYGWLSPKGWTLVVTTHPSAAQVVDMDLRNRALSLGQLRGCSLFHSSIKQIPNSIPVPLPCLGQLFALLEQSFCAGNFWQQRCQRQSFAARETQTQSNRRNPNPSPNPRTLPLLHLEDISYARTLTHTQRDCASSMSWPCVCAYLCVYPHAHHGAVECTTPSIPIQISPD